MSHFTKFISVQLPAIWDPYYTLTEALAYERYYEWSGKFIIIPAWTRTNFASLPWLLTAFWKKDDPRWIKSSIIHDYLWSKATTIKELQEANEIFYEAMLVEWTPNWIAVHFFLAVTISKYPYFLVNKTYYLC